MYFTASDHTANDGRQSCIQGHSSNLRLQTLEGGSICLLCLSNLISNPTSPTIHVSYALSQLSHALSQPQFLHTLLSFHPHFLVSPLVDALSVFDDEPIAKQITHLIYELCGYVNGSVYGEFVARVSDRISSGSLAWSCRQVYMLHCLGTLFDYQKNDPCIHIKDLDALVLNLVTGLRVPSEEIQGEILFVLYKISTLQHATKDDDGHDVLGAYCPKLLRLSLEALMKTQSDDVRLNCVALLSMLAQRGYFENGLANDLSSMEPYEMDDFVQMAELDQNGPPLLLLFAEAIKGPLLSSASEVQIATLDLIFLYLSCEGRSLKEVQVLVEENIADYVFEILRLSGGKDPMVYSCLQILDLLSAAESTFIPRLAFGFTTLVPVLRYVTELPLHPVQNHSLRLISKCLKDCPGIVSTANIEEIGVTLAGLFRKHIDGETGILLEAFILACSVLVALMKSPSSHGISSLTKSVQDATRNVILTCLRFYGKDSSVFLHSLYLLKEACAYGYERKPTTPDCAELISCILDLCKTKLLPWFTINVNEMEEDIALGILEVFHSILTQHSDIQTKELANILVSNSWFCLSFGCLGQFPNEKMKWRVYHLFGSILDALFENGSGQPIRDAALDLPSDPVDLLFLLGQKSSHKSGLLLCQSAALLILYASSLYDDRLADDKMVLASLEQYILLNGNELLHGAAEPVTGELLVNLYGLYRGLVKMNREIRYSPEAERILFQLLSEKEWNFLSTSVHFTSLKWLFQQERINKSLRNQILKLCRCMGTDNNLNVVSEIQDIDIRLLAELVASEDNFAAMLLVCLLRELVQGGQEDDIILVLNMIALILEIKPASSDQLCLHGIGIAIQNVYYHSSHSSKDIFMAISQLVFKILCSVHSESLNDGEAWLAVTMKLMDYLIPAVSANGWTQEALLLIGILSLILHHSLDQTLIEASKTILTSFPLVSTVNNTIYEACSKGPALFNHDEGTKTGEVLIFMLLLHYFSLKSVHAVLPGIVDAGSLLGDDKSKQPLSYISIHCLYVLRLLHFGSAPVKLVASYCLLEQFCIISEQKRKEPDKQKCSMHNLTSTRAVLEGLIFCADITVAMNCAHCLSMVLGWEKQNMQGQLSINENWCRLIVEELAMCLASPCLASKTFTIHHRPAVHVAVSLLKLQKVPSWMSAVFDDSCICGIIKNLSATNLTYEIVLLFQEMLNSGYLKAEHGAALNRVFQACRNHLYSENIQEDAIKKHIERVVANPDGLGRVCEFLINLVSSQSSLSKDSMGHHIRSKMLQEIELFCEAFMEGQDSPGNH